MNARTETLAEVIDWLGDEADREWERAKDGLSDGYDGFDAYTRAIQHCQDMIIEDEASSGKHAEIALLKHLADAHGATVLFGSKDAADLYAAEHDTTVGAPMPTMKAAALWSAARMTLAADGGLYEITALPDVERRTDAKRPGARMSGLSTMDVFARTPEDALALADRAGRAAVRMVEKGLAPNLAIGRLVYRERHWMEEDL